MSRQECVAVVGAHAIMAADLAEVRGEIRQARMLLCDAVGRLNSGFASISYLALARVASPARVGADANIAARLETELAAAVTSLQVEDLISQLLERAVRRVERLEAALQVAGGNVVRDAGDPAAAAVGRAPYPGMGTHSLVQHDMAPGDIELF